MKRIRRLAGTCTERKKGHLALFSIEFVLVRGLLGPLISTLSSHAGENTGLACKWRDYIGLYWLQLVDAFESLWNDMSQTSAFKRGVPVQVKITSAERDPLHHRIDPVLWVLHDQRCCLLFLFIHHTSGKCISPVRVALLFPVYWSNFNFGCWSSKPMDSSQVFFSLNLTWSCSEEALSNCFVSQDAFFCYSMAHCGYNIEVWRIFLKSLTSMQNSGCDQSEVCKNKGTVLSVSTCDYLLWLFLFRWQVLNSAWAWALQVDGASALQALCCSGSGLAYSMVAQ